MAKKLQGKVVSDSSDKTIIIQVSRAKVHPLYKKRYNRTAKYAVHDPDNRARVGQEVIVAESRPISRHKRWLLVEIVGQPPVKEAKETKPDQS